MKTNTDELLVFVTVIDSGSMTVAAEALAQTVSGVSRTLTRPEKKLGVTLVRRTTRHLQLTDEGDLFLGRARTILAAMNDAEEAISRRRERPSEQLRVDAHRPLYASLHCAARPGILRPLSRNFIGTDQQRAHRKFFGAARGYRHSHRRAAGFDAARAVAREEPLARARESRVSCRAAISTN